MRLKSISRKMVILLMLILVFVFTTGGVVTTKSQGRLRDFLENEHMYQYYPLSPLENMYHNNKNKKDSFKSILTGTPYIAFTGYVNSIASNQKQINVFESGSGIKIDTSKEEVKKIVSTIGFGSRVTVYGKIDGTEVDAEHIKVDSGVEYATQKRLYYPDNLLENCETITDLAKDQHVSFEIPSAWKSDLTTWGKLENNKVDGYQFFLNTLDQNWDNPEIFYIFYFKYETYLDKPPVDPSGRDLMYIEKLIMRNILTKLPVTSEYEIDDFIIQNGAEVDYCLKNYRPKDGRDYILEFTFKPDNKGLVCMLYLYYPNGDTNNHIHEVSYVINSVKN